jgi:threonine synthase
MTTKRLHCSRCDWTSALDALYNLCPACSSPILVHYDFGDVTINDERNDMWRYVDVLPVDSEDDIVTLGEGLTPLLLTKDGIYIKDESKNPTRSFKSRGMAAAVTMARKLGPKGLAAPTAGNAGAALAAYAARAGMPAFVAMVRRSR